MSEKEAFAGRRAPTAFRAAEATEHASSDGFSGRRCGGTTRVWSATNIDPSEHDETVSTPEKRTTDPEASKQLTENSTVAAARQKEKKRLDGELDAAKENASEFTDVLHSAAIDELLKASIKKCEIALPPMSYLDVFAGVGIFEDHFLGFSGHRHHHESRDDMHGNEYQSFCLCSHSA
jgi:hypothetical protein